ncbi:cyclin-domain-containing protein [Dendryphion nanum]|uniref:Cyclin-domain-containing protein n=1 Tax=Dendryphion nanum TaxID=256645 RepID=A0A9P9DFE3_9PLEO|nr:cyclin-domain-containing protein [Dendryphion nanum]
MLTSSPTISAPPSPSNTFHTHARTYHASRRTSSSASAPSPRFTPQLTATPRRLDPPLPPHTSATQAQSSATAFTRSPQPRRRDFTYTDSGTQYSPPGFPPTYRPPEIPLPPAAPSSPAAVALPETIASPVGQGGSSAQSAVTEPPAPALRVEPQPVVPPQTLRPARRTSSEIDADSRQQEGAQEQASIASLGQSSPAKRARPQDRSVKVMPFKYETCDVKDLGVLISDMLMELVRLNDGFPLRDGQLTRFHSRAPPGISVRDYLFRLIVHATLSPPILLSMVFYVDKLCTMYPAFTISSLTVHRFLITAATVAAKGLSDSFWTNSLYAKVGGVSVRELALLELEFLRRLEWRIVPKPETLVDYYKGLVERGEGYVMERDQETGPTQSTTPSVPQAGQPELSAAS